MKGVVLTFQAASLPQYIALRTNNITDFWPSVVTQTNKLLHVSFLHNCCMESGVDKPVYRRSSPQEKSIFSWEEGRGRLTSTLMRLLLSFSQEDGKPGLMLKRKPENWWKCNKLTDSGDIIVWKISLSGGLIYWTYTAEPVNRTTHWYKTRR